MGARIHAWLTSALSGRQRTLLWLIGYGCFMTNYRNGLSTPISSSVFDITWSDSLLIQFLYLAVSGIAFLILWMYLRSGKRRPLSLWGAQAYVVVMILCLIARYLCYLFQPSIGLPLLGIITGISGIVSTYPLLFWFLRLCNIYKTAGRARCIAILAFAQLFIVIPMILSVINQIAALVIDICLVLCTAIIQIRLAQSSESNDETHEVAIKSQKHYELNIRSIATLISFGITWGLSYALIIFGSTTLTITNLLWWLLLLMQALVSSILFGIFFIRNHTGLNMRYGLFIRISVISAGMVLMLTPIFSELSISALYPFCIAVVVLQSVAMWIFSIEMCGKDNRNELTTFTLNYFLFIIAACLGAGLFVLFQNVVGGHFAWDLLAALAAVATVIIIPLLPSNSSTAVSFALYELPENENTETRTERTYRNLVTDYKLSEREAQIFKFLAQGMTHQEIADELHLSIWTVKDYVAGLYEKTQTHSYKELMRLFNDMNE